MSPAQTEVGGGIAPAKRINGDFAKRRTVDSFTDTSRCKELNHQGGRGTESTKYLDNHRVEAYNIPYECPVIAPCLSRYAMRGSSRRTMHFHDGGFLPGLAERQGRDTSRLAVASLGPCPFIVGVVREGTLLEKSCHALYPGEHGTR